MKQNYSSTPIYSEKEFQEKLRRAETVQERLHLIVRRSRFDPAFFAKAFLSHHFRLPFAQYHHTLFRWHHSMGTIPLNQRSGQRYSLAAPRGTAKSTIVSLLLVLHNVIFEQERYILLISATQRQAEQRLRAIRRELTNGTLLSKTFHSRLHQVPITLSKNVLSTHFTRIEAFGAGSEMRGISFEGYRPTKIILDDSESSASAESPRRRQKLHDWFGEVIEHLGHPYTHLLAIGTVLHPESLLSTLLNRPDFVSLRIRSIETFALESNEWKQWRAILTDPALEDRRQEARNFFHTHRKKMLTGTSVVWPESEDYEELMKQLVTQGRRAFYQEKQNEPLGPEDALFDLETIWKAEKTPTGWQVVSPFTLPKAHPQAPTKYHVDDLQFFAHLDSALGKSASKRQGDYACIAIVAKAPNGYVILVDLWAKRAAPSEQIRVLFDLHQHYNLTLVSVEGTGFQELLAHPIKEEADSRKNTQGFSSPEIQYVIPRRKKELRIAGLEPLLSTGKLSLAETLPEEFWRELSDFPESKHDDALDATAGAVETAQTAQPKVSRKLLTLNKTRRGPRI